MPRRARVQRCLSASNDELRRSYIQRPHHQTLQALPVQPILSCCRGFFEYNTARLNLGPKALQQQAQHGRQILLLAHHLLAQVCLDSYEHGMS